MLPLLQTLQQRVLMGIELEKNWPRGKARAGLLLVLFLLFHLQSEIQTSEEEKKKVFAVTSAMSTEKEKESFRLRKGKTPIRKLERTLLSSADFTE